MLCKKPAVLPPSRLVCCKKLNVVEHRLLVKGGGMMIRVTPLHDIKGLRYMQMLDGAAFIAVTRTT